MIFGVLELWPPPIAVEPLTVVAWVVVGLLDLLMGTPPGILGGPLGPIVGLMGVVGVTVLAVAGFIVIEVNRRRRVSLLPPSDE